MKTVQPRFPITAIVYPKGSDFEAFLQEVTDVMAARGLRLAGLVQHSQPRPGRAKCDIYLRDLSAGDISAISDDRGPHARGCVLNTDRLLNACEVVEAGLSDGTDLLVLCKFGKTEVEGGGFRSLMTRALELSIPVLIGIPEINLMPFRQFAAGFAREIKLSDFASDRVAAAERLCPASWPSDEAMAVSA